MARRDKSPKDKQSVGLQNFVDTATTILDEIQQELHKRAKVFMDSHTFEVNTLEEFNKFFTEDNNISSGFVTCFASDDPVIEDFIKPLKVTARCIPIDQIDASGICIFTGKAVTKRMVFAKAY